MRWLIGVMIWVMSVPAWAFDASRYVEKKATGSVTLGKVGGSVIASERRFDSETGVKLPDQTEVLRMSDLDEEMARLETKLAALKALKADIQALP